ncbi:hypothetical protein EJ05DRAFT_1428 [Pseudovirgaria hyperparasitica]|uniref:Uncharacterized protein n=1 Tax=Pseudovirgaria hyperparasitica TaxID=470096 RepID=A0A6A6WJ64_9PEZI|nr:uncharacterized protein EJ05DRAFT_1428 [Pseudovirgaria hyperparasitica]KAF2762429.1 hypothetical protein EJ05DRAFT_1428 [Pseudovirgaria hyperparasitica]
MPPKSTPTFEFVSVNPKDAAVRRLDPDAMFRVRRQAMVVAYRGRDKTNLQVATKKVPSLTKACETHRWLATEQGAFKSKQVKRKRKPLVHHLREDQEQEFEMALDPLLTLSVTDYAALRNEFGVDIVSLAVLGELDVGLFAFDSLNKRPGRISEVLSQGHSESWLRHLPSHYGYCEYLDDAIRCVSARLNQRIAGTVNEVVVWRLYGKALRSLQNAIESPGGWMNTNVLYASHLLAMFELLAPGQRYISDGWNRHRTGTIRLLESRGPEHYSTSFDRAILRAQAMSVVSDRRSCSSR